MRIRLSPTNRRLAIFGVMLMAAIAVATAWLIITRRNDDLAKNQRGAAELAQVLAEQTSRTLQPVDLTLRAIQQRLIGAVRQGPDDLSWWTSRATFDQLTEQLRSLPQLDALIIVDANGHLANYTRRYPTPVSDLSDREYFRYLSTNDDHGLYISAPTQTRDEGIWTIHLARRVNDSAGAFAGVAVAAVTIAHLEDFYRAVTPAEGAVTLLRAMAQFWAATRRWPRQQGFKLPAEAPWYDIVAAGGGSYLSPGYLDREERLVSVRPLRDYKLVIDFSMPRVCGPDGLAAGGSLAGRRRQPCDGLYDRPVGAVRPADRPPSAIRTFARAAERRT